MSATTANLNTTSSNTNTNTNGNGKNSSNNGNSNSRCNLIVNYLPQSLKEHDFCQLFAKIGPLKTCKLMYDKQTGYSFGYGFVDYQNVEDATKAIETLNGYQIEHKRLKVAYARPNCEDTKNTNLYIRNVPTNFDESSLNDLFSQFGEVVQVRILRDPVTNFSRRIGFVIMSTKQMAQTAIENLDNRVPNGGTEPIYVKYADEEGKKRHAPRNQSGGGGGGHGGMYNTNAIGANGLQNLGKMKSNRGNNQNRYNPMSANYGYPYSNFTQTGSSNFDGLINGFHNGFINATQNGHGGHHGGHNNHHGGAGGHHGGHNNHHNHHQHHGGGGGHHNQSNRHNHHQHHHGNNGGGSLTSNTVNGLLQFDNANGNSLGEKGGHIIYVYGIGPHASESDLYTLFQNVGRILRVNVIKNQKTGLGKGYGFVVFEHYEEACCAVQHMNGFIYNNRPLQVAFKAFKNQ